jgi:hypothetical protein
MRRLRTRDEGVALHVISTSLGKENVRLVEQ